MAGSFLIISPRSCSKANFGAELAHNSGLGITCAKLKTGGTTERLSRLSVGSRRVKERR